METLRRRVAAESSARITAEQRVSQVLLYTYMLNATVHANLHNKRRYVCLSVCLSVADGRPNGWADQHQTWHRDSC